MINWIFFPILAAFLWAIVNHLDKYLLSKYCKNREIGGLIIFSGLIAIPVVIVLIILNPQIIIDIHYPSVLFIIVSGMCYLLGIIPYLYALEDDEVSTVAPQMIMIIVFSSLLGYIFLGEKLSLIQMLGSLIIILGALLISLDIRDILNTKLKSKVFFLMVIATFLISLNALLFKYVALETTFISTVFWLHVGYFLITIIIFIAIKKYRQQFFNLVNINPISIISINFLGELITIIGNISVHYATLLVPLALAEVVVEGIQPFFVLIISILITKFFPHLGEKQLHYKEVVLKCASILLMILGLILINLNP